MRGGRDLPTCHHCAASGLNMMALALCCFAAAAAGETPPPLPYQNASLPIAARVADLLGRMTLDERIAQTFAIHNDHPYVLDLHAATSYGEQTRSVFVRVAVTRIAVADDDRRSSRATRVIYNPLSDRLLSPGEQKLSGFDAADAPSLLAQRNAYASAVFDASRLGIPLAFYQEVRDDAARRGIPRRG